MRLLPFLGLAVAALAGADWTLHLLDASKYPSARCLDGSMGGFYVQPGSPANVDKWIIHFQGGGWCYSPEDCASRAAGVNPFRDPVSLGGTGKWAQKGCAPSPDGNHAPPCVSDGGSHGMLSPDPAVNPHYHDWSRAWVGYCDGGSYAGDLVEPFVLTRLFYFSKKVNLN